MHAHDHNRHLHADKLTLIKLYKILREEFQEDTALMATISSFLLTQCELCGLLFNSMSDRNAHMNTCLKRWLTLSTYYGEPLAVETFEPYHSKQVRDRKEKDHALACIKRLAQSVMTDIRRQNSSSEVVDESTGDSTSERDLFKEAIAREVDTDISVQLISVNPSSSGDVDRSIQRRRKLVTRLQEVAQNRIGSSSKTVHGRKKPVTRYFLADPADNVDYDDDDDGEEEEEEEEEEEQEEEEQEEEEEEEEEEQEEEEEKVEEEEEEDEFERDEE